MADNQTKSILQSLSDTALGVGVHGLKGLENLVSLPQKSIGSLFPLGLSATGRLLGNEDISNLGDESLKNIWGDPFFSNPISQLLQGFGPEGEHKEGAGIIDPNIMQPQGDFEKFAFGAAERLPFFGFSVPGGLTTAATSAVNTLAPKLGAGPLTTAGLEFGTGVITNSLSNILKNKKSIKSMQRFAEQEIENFDKNAPIQQPISEAQRHKLWDNLNNIRDKAAKSLSKTGFEEFKHHLQIIKKDLADPTGINNFKDLRNSWKSLNNIIRTLHKNKKPEAIPFLQESVRLIKQEFEDLAKQNPEVQPWVSKLFEANNAYSALKNENIIDKFSQQAVDFTKKNTGGAYILYNTLNSLFPGLTKIITGMAALGPYTISPVIRRFNALNVSPALKSSYNKMLKGIVNGNSNSAFKFASDIANKLHKLPAEDDLLIEIDESGQEIGTPIRRRDIFAKNRLTTEFE